MPKSKRSKVVSLTKVAKKSREDKEKFINEVQECADKWQYCWLFDVGSMRNAHLKTVRTYWKGSRLFFGRCAILQKALGATEAEEQKPGLSKITSQLKGQVGLLFTDEAPQVVTDWFADFSRPDFARAGNIITKSIALPSGPIMQKHSDTPEPFPHNEEPQLRRLGLHTTMVRGVPTLENPHQVCAEGKPLTGEQAQLLKLIGERTVEFKIRLRARWDAATGEVHQIEDTGTVQNVVQGDDGDEELVSDP